VGLADTGTLGIGWKGNACKSGLTRVNDQGMCLSTSLIGVCLCICACMCVLCVRVWGCCIHQHISGCLYRPELCAIIKATRWDKSAHNSIEKRRRKKTTQVVKATPHIKYGKGATLVPSTVKLLHREKEKSMGIKRVAGWAWHRLPMRVDNSIGKGTSGMHKVSSEVHRVHMLLNIHCIRTFPKPCR
jgi:hypothetical protein